MSGNVIHIGDVPFKSTHVHWRQRSLTPRAYHVIQTMSITQPLAAMAWPLAWVYARLLPSHPYLAAVVAAVVESSVMMGLGWAAEWGAFEHFVWFVALHAGGQAYRWQYTAGRWTLLSTGPVALPQLVFLGWLGMLFHAGPAWGLALLLPSVPLLATSPLPLLKLPLASLSMVRDL